MNPCVRCGVMFPPAAPQCPACGTPASPVNPFAEQANGNPYASPPPVAFPVESGNVDHTLSWIVPVHNPVLAVISSYCGLFSLVFCFLGPVAVVTGILAIRQIQRNPKLVGMGRCIAGIILGLIGSISLLVFISMLIVESMK